MDWQDLHVAFIVSQMGTVSGAAQKLGVHHATVIRHVDRLESELGQKLFRRHARGYEPTDAGQSLFNVAAVAKEHFSLAQARLEDREAEITGKIVITTLPTFGDLFLPAFTAFHKKYPEVLIRLESSTRLYRLEYGEAHLAIRAGERPSDPDNIPLHLMDLEMGLYANREYTENHGQFTGDNPEDHYFVGAIEGRGPFYKWLRDEGLEQRIVFDTGDPNVALNAVCAGLGLGFVSQKTAEARDDLIEHLAPRKDWQIQIWQVTHRDMHRSPKVQAMSECLKSFVASLSK